MASPLFGQITVSGSAQVLAGTARDVTAFTIKAPLSNTNPVFLGDSTVTTSNGHQLDPGDEVNYERRSQNAAPTYPLKPSDFYVVGTAPDRVTWLGSP